MTHLIGSGEMPTDAELDGIVAPSHGTQDPIAYTYEADHHCPACAFRRFGADADGWIAMRTDDGSVGAGGPCKDGEGNPVGVIAPWDEWQSFDGGPETLACGTCGAVIDTYEPESDLW